MQVSVRAQDGHQDDALGALMYDAIHNARSQYTAAERQAWLAAQQVAVAHKGCALLGFMTLKGDYIDLAFVAAHAQGRGVFRSLFAWVESAAQGQQRLWTHASLMAQPAFLAVGFRVIRHETVAQKGQHLRRAEMEKLLK